MFEFLRWFGATVFAAAVGWGSCSYWHGLSINPWAATDTAQKAVDVAVQASAGIDERARGVVAAKERVRTTAASTSVATECPPGRGPVSADMADRLRIAFSAPSATSASSTAAPAAPAGVRPSSQATVPAARD